MEDFEQSWACFTCSTSRRAADRDSITTYLEREELYLAANEVLDAHKVPVFLTLIGWQTYVLLRDLLLPKKPAAKFLKTLMDTLKKYYKP